MHLHAWQEPHGFFELNLRQNPFGEASREARAEMAVIPPALVELMQRPEFFLQVVGEAGNGKSTHLLGLARIVPESRYEYVPEGRTAPQTTPAAGSLFLLDEAQRVVPRRLQALMQKYRRLVLGTHEDLSRFTSRPLITIHLAALSLEKLAAVVAARLSWARLQAGPVPEPTPARLAELLARHGACLRAIEADLYDDYQALARRARRVEG